MRILLVSPYHGGSHASWAQGLERHSRHTVELLTLPDRFWKWRMHGGAATLGRRFLADHQRPDVILATDMLDLTTFLALTRAVTADIPAVLYMHENQLTYPLPAERDAGPMRRQGGERDHHYAFVNFSSMLAADRVVFNSAFHRDAWFHALPRFLRHFPEHNELGSVDELRSRSCVLPVGIETDDLEASAATPDSPAPPLIIWNQRWEYDKNPAQLLRALREVADRGVAFRLAVCGQAFGKSPPGFEGIEEMFGDRLIHLGFAGAEHYRRLLVQATLTVSTADHEFFGVGGAGGDGRRRIRGVARAPELPGAHRRTGGQRRGERTVPVPIVRGAGRDHRLGPRGQPRSDAHRQTTGAQRPPVRLAPGRASVRHPLRVRLSGILPQIAASVAGKTLRLWKLTRLSPITCRLF